jgi:hypothetical protein
MPNYFGGDVVELKVEHPTIGSFTLEPKANEDTESDRGGIRMNDDDSQITGAGNIILSGTRTRPYLQITVATNNELTEKLIQWSESSELASITYTHINGDVVRGKAIPVGDIKPSTLNSTVQIKLAGSGKFVKI